MNEVKEMSQVVKGVFKDTITYKDGRQEVREWTKNLIVNSIGKLIAALFKSQSGYTGLSYWAIGTGTTAAQSSDTVLDTEIGRKAIVNTNIKFLDAQGNETASVTNVLKVTATFTTSDFNGYTWTEFGLFGGNASATIDSGLMVDRVVHSGIAKTSEMTITREIRFTFN